MEFTPGKYRMANGEMAVVVCDVGENPIGSQDMHPIKGFTASGPAAWNRDGRHQFFFDGGSNLVEPWTDPPTPLEALKMLRALFNGDIDAYYEATQRALLAADGGDGGEKARTANVG